jgi:hypothetical protein
MLSKGQPCRMPRLGLIWLEGSPLTKTERVVVEMQAYTRLIKWWDKPKRLRGVTMKF